MKSIRIIEVLVILLFLYSCNDNIFPKDIQNKLSDEHFRIKGTKVFVKNIDDYTYVPEVNIFKYSDSVYIHCLYTECDFENSLKVRDFDFYHNNNYRILDSLSFRINKNEGIYYKLEENEYYYSYFIFGDSQVEIRVVSIYPKSLASVFELATYEFMKSVYYEKDYEINPLEYAKFNIDLTSSSYEFISFSMNNYVYMQKPDDVNDRPNNIFITQIPYLIDTLNQRVVMNSTIERLKVNGISIDSVRVVRVLLNQINSLKAEIWGEFENKKIYSEIYTTGNNKGGLLYGGTLYNNINHNKEELSEILGTVKIK